MRWSRVLLGALSCTVLVVTVLAAVVDSRLSAIQTITITPSPSASPHSPALTPSSPVLPEPQQLRDALPSLSAPGDFTVLLLGSDSRTGKGNRGYGSVAGQRSDTAVLARVAGGRTLAVSIPRDMTMRLPDCAGSVVGRFNAAFSAGGPACALQAVQDLTGVGVDHLVVVDFAAVKAISSLVGGVEVCLPYAVDDPYSGLKLPAGVHTVQGEQALAWVRARHGLEDGSDISRMRRQQEFLLSLLDKTKDALANPVSALELVSQAAPYLAVSDSLADSRALASVALGLASTRVRTATLPWRANADGATVSLDEAAARPFLEWLSGTGPWPSRKALPSSSSPAACLEPGSS